MKIPFKKMSGAGNDFIVVDNRDDRLPRPIERIVPGICDRSTPWKGADGFIALVPTHGADFEMLYYNADGTTGAMCGNGGRCAARFATLSEIVKSTHAEFLAVGQLYLADIHRERVTLAMPPPRTLDLNRTLHVMNQELTCHYVNVETPHAIIFIDDIKVPQMASLNDVDLAIWGPAVRSHPDFQPEGANANFAMIRTQKSGDQIVALRTWERGVEGETLACGTGSVATAIAAHFVRGIPSPVRVATMSGETLTVNFVRDGTSVRDLTLEGSAVVELEGEFSV